MFPRLTGKPSIEGVHKALIISGVIVSLGLAIFFGGIGIGLMFWLMK